MQPYSQDFFIEQQSGSRKSAAEIVPIVMSLLQPQSIIDIGCGVGAWLSVFREHGIEDTLGIDGDYVDTKLLLIPQECFKSHDLTRPYISCRKYDLAICLEVAEHLPKDNAEVFIDSLTQFSSIVLFSAAVPKQGGVHHINEQWQDYWAQLFAQRGYLAIDCLRSKIWSNESVLWWYAQNMLLYVRAECLSNYPALLTEAGGKASLPISLVHPRMYLGLAYNSNPDNIGISKALGILTASFKNALRRRVRPLRHTTDENAK